MPKRVLIRCDRSMRRQRTTPCSDKLGPSFTSLATSASCSEVSRGFGPGGMRLDSPATPRSLYRCTQSRSVWRSMPHKTAASVRGRPSRTRAKASIRRDASESRDCAAARRSPDASNSIRVIETAMPPPESMREERITSCGYWESHTSQKLPPLVSDRLATKRRLKRCTELSPGYHL